MHKKRILLTIPYYIAVSMPLIANPANAAPASPSISEGKFNNRCFKIALNRLYACHSEMFK